MEQKEGFSSTALALEVSMLLLQSAKYVFFLKDHSMQSEKFDN